MRLENKLVAYINFFPDSVLHSVLSYAGFRSWAT